MVILEEITSKLSHENWAGIEREWGSKSWNIKFFSRATKESEEGVLGGDTEEEYILSTLQDI